jgi:hypothetical protein
MKSEVRSKWIDNSQLCWDSIERRVLSRLDLKPKVLRPSGVRVAVHVHNGWLANHRT